MSEEAESTVPVLVEQARSLAFLAAREWLRKRWCQDWPNEAHCQQLADYAEHLRRQAERLAAQGAREAVAGIDRDALAELAADTFYQMEGQYKRLDRSMRQTWENVVDVMLALTAAPDAAQVVASDRYRHLKRGTVYEVIGTAELQNGNVKGLREGAILTVYRGEDGKLWARDQGEFHDGRFERLPEGRAAGQEGAR